jgi:hypothetical protein
LRHILERIGLALISGWYSGRLLERSVKMMVDYLAAKMGIGEAARRYPVPLRTASNRRCIARAGNWRQIIP